MTQMKAPAPATSIPPPTTSTPAPQARHRGLRYPDDDKYWVNHPDVNAARKANRHAHIQLEPGREAQAPRPLPVPQIPQTPPVSPARGASKTIRACKSQPLRSPKAKVQAEVRRIEAPHPSQIQPPAPRAVIQGYYAITVGQEVGLFYTWPDVQARISGVSGNTQAKYDSFLEALQVYSDAYVTGHVIAQPVPNGPFDKFQQAAVRSPLLRTPTRSAHTPTKSARADGPSRLPVVDLCTSDEESDGDEIMKLTLALSLKATLE
ncbi:hypothetical protein Hypma_008436 [Hypsizygus marmoreus]|uniref:Ribonuclease H1 N-terminal domain-containing protein n=1 Tax=Hypsizygus marmoreus TaxID=39966 RepID=A0A369JRJ3_HYPMA|nr:hypothetical protein Hypma_008436 [Hypsizygus marmoreus]